MPPYTQVLSSTKFKPVLPKRTLGDGMNVLISAPSNMVAISQMWLFSIGNVARVTEELIFKFNLN